MGRTRRGLSGATRDARVRRNEKLEIPAHPGSGKGLCWHTAALRGSTLVEPIDTPRDTHSSLSESCAALLLSLYVAHNHSRNLSSTCSPMRVWRGCAWLSVTHTRACITPTHKHNNHATYALFVARMPLARKPFSPPARSSHLAIVTPAILPQQTISSRPLHHARWGRCVRGRIRAWAHPCAGAPFSAKLPPPLQSLSCGPPAHRATTPPHVDPPLVVPAVAAVVGCAPRAAACSLALSPAGGALTPPGLMTNAPPGPRLTPLGACRAPRRRP